MALLINDQTGKATCSRGYNQLTVDHSLLCFFNAYILTSQKNNEADEKTSRTFEEI